MRLSKKRCIAIEPSVVEDLKSQNTYSELYPVLEDGADTQAVEQKIEQICDQTVGSRWLSYQNTDKQLYESYQQIKPGD